MAKVVTIHSKDKFGIGDLVMITWKADNSIPYSEVGLIIDQRFKQCFDIQWLRSSRKVSHCVHANYLKLLSSAADNKQERREK